MRNDGGSADSYPKDLEEGAELAGVCVSERVNWDPDGSRTDDRAGNRRVELLV